MTTCKECGNTYDESYGVCPKCGRPCEQELTKNNVYVPPMPAPMQTLTPKKKNSKAKLITILSIAGVVLVGLIIALVMIFSQPDVQAQVKEQLSLGEKYLLEEDYDEAIVAFKKAIDIQPNNPELYMKLSDAYIAKGDMENAIKALEDGYAKTGSEDIKKKLDELKLNLQYAKYIEDGKTALSNNEYNTAIENFENAVALKPNEVEPYLSAADGYIGNSDDDGAIAILEKGYGLTESKEIKNRLDSLTLTATNLVQKSIPEIIEILGNDYEVIAVGFGGYIYIQNEEILPDVKFYIYIGDDIENYETSYESSTLKNKLKSGVYSLSAIEIGGTAKADSKIRVGMNYTECCDILGKMECSGGHGGFLGGALTSVVYEYYSNGAEVSLNFEINGFMDKLNNNTLTTEDLIEHNPKIKCIVVQSGQEFSRNTGLKDFNVETAVLTDDDIKPEWTNVMFLNFEYPIFHSDDKETEKFLDKSISQEMLKLMATDTDYQVMISSYFQWHLVSDRYLSIDSSVSNHPYMGNGTRAYPKTFLADLKERKIISFKDLFQESNDKICTEITAKLNKYADSDMLFSEIKYDMVYQYISEDSMQFTITEYGLTIIFPPYSIAPGIAGSPHISIPWSDLDLTCLLFESTI